MMYSEQVKERELSSADFSSALQCIELPFSHGAESTSPTRTQIEVIDFTDRKEHDVKPDSDYSHR
jgi:hypothetical protein